MTLAASTMPWIQMSRFKIPIFNDIGKDVWDEEGIKNNSKIIKTFHDEQQKTVLTV